MNIREILVLHHSHLDVGYTHGQPVLWELQKEFIDLALLMLDETADWPEVSRPRWTIEATAQILRWMQDAGPEQVEALRAHISSGRIGISGMQYNTTPLSNPEQLCRQLRPVRDIEKEFGTRIRTVHQHDVNGITWSMVDIMKDAGIDLLVMAINLHFGRYAAERPSVFRWQGPSGREILALNGEHYTMFDQLLYSWENSTDRMAEGLSEYREILERKRYPHDFIYLTTADAPVSWDNSPPNMNVARLIRRWNEEGRTPVIRYVTPLMLLERVAALPGDKLPVYRGDWTDYWNFGAGSSAVETSVNQGTKKYLFMADLINTTRTSAVRSAKALERAWNLVNLFDEHTWGAANAMNHDALETTLQWNLKAAPAWEARSLAAYGLTDSLESLAGNPASSDGQEGILVFNPANAPFEGCIRIPGSWFSPGKRNRTSRMAGREFPVRKGDSLYGPVSLSPFEFRKIPFAGLAEAESFPELKCFPEPSKPVPTAGTFISGNRPEIWNMENRHYRLSVDRSTGRILCLYDNSTGREITSRGSLDFFHPVHEQPDPLVDGRREALYDRDMEKERKDVSCWKSDWAARRQGPQFLKDCRLDIEGDSVRLTRSYAFPGTNELVQTIVLKAGSPVIELAVSMDKQDVRTPEAIYLAIPLALDAGWTAEFDNGGIPIRLDEDQLPGACRGWVTADTWAAVYDGKRGAALFCPDAPLVQIGGFQFGRNLDAVPRDADPLLVAWPVNNYWNTNFRASQPGRITLRYGFMAFDAPGLEPVRRQADAFSLPVLVHPCMECGQGGGGEVMAVEGDGARILHVHPLTGETGLAVRLVSMAESEAEFGLRFSGRPVKDASVSGVYDEEGAPVSSAGEQVRFNLVPRRVTTIKVRF